MRQGLCNGTESVRLSVSSIDRCSSVRRVCCCGPGEQELSIDCCTAGVALSSSCEQCHVVSWCRKTCLMCLLQLHDAGSDSGASRRRLSGSVVVAVLCTCAVLLCAAMTVSCLYKLALLERKLDALQPEQCNASVNVGGSHKGSVPTTLVRKERCLFISALYTHQFAVSHRLQWCVFSIKHRSHHMN